MKGCLVRYNEIALKGTNFKDFENLLVKNIRKRLKTDDVKFDNIVKVNKRILIKNINEYDSLKYIFGIASFSGAVSVDLYIDKIKNKVLELVKDVKFKKFRVSTRRQNKNFFYNSLQVNAIIGDFIKNNLNKKVDLKNFDLDIGIEILDMAYIFVGKFKGLGGLPLGSEGSVAALIEDRKSLLAAYLAMKRGCKAIPVAFKKSDTGLLKKFDHDLRLNIVKNIKEIEKISGKNNCKAIISGQTLDDFGGIKTKLVVLRPLIGLNEEEIRNKLDYLQKL